jgi:hypothetical protein
MPQLSQWRGGVEGVTGDPAIAPCAQPQFGPLRVKTARRSPVSATGQARPQAASLSIALRFSSISSANNDMAAKGGTASGVAFAW